MRVTAKAMQISIINDLPFLLLVYQQGDTKSILKRKAFLPEEDEVIMRATQTGNLNFVEIQGVELDPLVYPTDLVC